MNSQTECLQRLRGLFAEGARQYDNQQISANYAGDTLLGAYCNGKAATLHDVVEELDYLLTRGKLKADD